MPAGRSVAVLGRLRHGDVVDARVRVLDRVEVENPYVGCGTTRDRSARRYLDRTRHRAGMVTAAVVRAFRSIGWGWGGAWSGSTKDYMHFSSTGH